MKAVQNSAHYGLFQQQMSSEWSKQMDLSEDRNVAMRASSLSMGNAAKDEAAGQRAQDVYNNTSDALRNQFQLRNSNCSMTDLRKSGAQA